MTANRKDITPELLQELYINKNMSSYKIGKQLNCYASTINSKLHMFGIKIKKPFRKVDLTKNQLIDLYITKKISTYKIAKLIGCSVKTISNKMKAFKIKGRPISKTPISTERLNYLYKKRGLSLKEIGQIYKMTPSGILKRTKKAKVVMRKSWESNTGVKKPFNGNLEEKAYIIGFRLGDLGIRQSSPKTKMIIVGSNTTKKDQILLMSNLFEKYSKIWVSNPNQKGVMSFSTILHPSFSFLLPKQDGIEKWICKNNKFMTSFVSGYIDAEGSFGVYNNRGKFRVGSYDKNILKQIHQWLLKLNIKSIIELERIKKIGQNRDFWRITINDAPILHKLYKLLRYNLRHKKRLADFDKVEENVLLRLKNGTIHL